MEACARCPLIIFISHLEHTEFLLLQTLVGLLENVLLYGTLNWQVTVFRTFTYLSFSPFDYSERPLDKQKPDKMFFICPQIKFLTINIQTLLH